MNRYDDLKTEINGIVEVGKKLYSAIVPNDEGEAQDLVYFFKNYEKWYSKSIPVIKLLLPDRLNDFKLLYKNEKRKELTLSTYTISDALRGIQHINGIYRPSTAHSCFWSQYNIIVTCLDTFDSKIFDMQMILQADVFDSEIDSAKHLLKKGFYRAAGAICGVIIEKHFAGVCANHNITITKKNPTIADYNDKLKDNVYDIIEWRRIQRLGDLRNLCDHNKDREPTSDEVDELIAGTEKIIKTIF